MSTSIIAILRIAAAGALLPLAALACAAPQPAVMSAEQTTAAA